MYQESKYRVVLLDENGYDLGERPADNLRDAKEKMRYLLSDAYPKLAETNHETMGTYKAEVRNTAGECIMDDFHQPGLLPTYARLARA